MRSAWDSEVSEDGGVEGVTEDWARDSSVVGFGFGFGAAGNASVRTHGSEKELIIRVLSESRAIPLLSKCIRQPRYEAAMTEAPAAMANLCRERPTAELAELVVCNPRRRASLVTPLSICG